MIKECPVIIKMLNYCSYLALFLFSADTCKAKWRTLRDSFVRQRKKVSASGSAGGPQKEWKFNDIMSFLVLHIQQRRSGKNHLTVW